MDEPIVARSACYTGRALMRPGPRYSAQPHIVNHAAGRPERATGTLLAALPPHRLPAPMAQLIAKIPLRCPHLELSY